MKRILPLIPCLCLLSVASFAQQPTRDDLLKMFDVLRVKQQTEVVMQTTLANMKQQVKADIAKRYPNLSPAAAERLEQSYNDAINIYPVSEMLDDLIPVYQKYLTKADVDAIVAFYSSPAGQHFLDQMPVMTKEAMQSMMTKLQKRSADYADKVEKQAEELAEPKK